MMGYVKVLGIRRILMLGLIMKIINSELCFYVFNLKIYVIFKGFVCYFYI